MTLKELQTWILSEHGMKAEIDMLCRYSASKEFQCLELSEEISKLIPNWRKLIFAGSILATLNSSEANEISLRIALCGLLYSGNKSIEDACATILTQLSNYRTIKLAIDKNYLLDGLEKRVGIIEGLLLERRELEQLIIPANNYPIKTSRFQKEFWDKLNISSWVSASAPTASGKTFLVLQWLLNEFSLGKVKLAVFIAPTRALIGEVERELFDLAAQFNIAGLRISSLPLASFGDRSQPTILVFTQERLHVFLNYIEIYPNIDITIIDEAHKIGDNQRGVLLQDAIEKIYTKAHCKKIVFLSPLAENPEIFMQDAPQKANNSVIPNEIFTVVQNLFIAEQAPRNTTRWILNLVLNSNIQQLGNLYLHSRPDTDIKRLSFLALALGNNNTGTLVYANGAAEAEKIAQQIFEGLTDDEQAKCTELKDLSDFIKKTIHPKFLLASIVLRGVAFHYGNMPTLLRTEIETLFKNGFIRFLVCTSTLIEGVNLACRTIVVRGPRKGNGKPMKPHDFWNLAGRAGRWGQDFSGNIVCIDVNRQCLWPGGIPKRSRYPIKRETENVLGNHQEVLNYVNARMSLDPSRLTPQFEQTLAYLLSWQLREGTFLKSPTAQRLSQEYALLLNNSLQHLASHITIPDEIILRHPGVSAISLQNLFNYFQRRKEPIEELLPSPPESDDAYESLVKIFSWINDYAYVVFSPPGAIPVFALVTLEWMRGSPLKKIIQNRINYLERHNRPYKLPAEIRDTMRVVDEVARFQAPKFLSAYIDVLKYYLKETGRSYLLSDGIKYDIYLEFGVSTQTLLSLIGIGLSRTSAIAINDFLANDKMAENDVISWLRERRWESFDLPAIVYKEINKILERKDKLAS